MRPQILRQNPNLTQIGLVVLALVISIAAGTSFLVSNSPFSPLIIGGTALLFVILLICLRKPDLALYAAVFIIFLPNDLIPAQVNSLLNRTLTIAAFAFWLFNVIVRRKKIIVTGSTLLMGGFILWAAITLFWSLDLSRGTSILQTYILRLVLFLLLIANEVRTRKDLDRLINVLAVSGVLLIIVAIGTVFIQGYSPGTRLQVLSVNANGLGISLLQTLPAVLLWAHRPAKQNISWLKKSLAAIFLIVSFGLIGFSGSRGSAISLGAILIAFLLWKSTRPWGLLGISVLGLALIAAPFVFTTTLQRFLDPTGETLLGGREYLWQAAWQLILAHPWFGVGIGASSSAAIPYILETGGLGRIWSMANGASLHNPVLTIWGDTGIPGLLLYLGALGVAARSFVLQFVRSRRKKIDYLLPYFPLVASMFLGYLASWIKGGGMESDFSFFLMLALLLIPANLEPGELSAEV